MYVSGFFFLGRHFHKIRIDKKCNNSVFIFWFVTMSLISWQCLQFRRHSTFSRDLGICKMDVFSMAGSLCTSSTLIGGDGDGGDLISTTPIGRFLYCLKQCI